MPTDQADPPERIEKLRAALEALATSADRNTLMESVLDAIDNTLVVTDPNRPDNPIIWVNRQFEELTGYSFDEAVGQNCRFLQGDDREQEAIEQLKACVRRGESAHVELRNYRKDGSMFWNELYISPVYVKGGPVLYLGVQNDVTERVHLQQESERIKNTLLESARDAIVVTSAGGGSSDATIKYANPAFLKMTGYTFEEVEGQTPHILQGEQTSKVVLDRLREAMAEVRTFQGETVNYRKDGTPYQLEWKITPVLEDDGTPSSWLSIQRDVTERRKLERELLQVSAREQARLARDLHDNVQQHLLAVKMFAANLRKQHREDGLGEALGTLEHYLGEALRNLRAVSRGLAPGEFEYQGFMVAVERLTRTFDQLHDAHYTFDYEHPVVVRDTEKAEHLYRIVQEALSNVAKHAEAGRVQVKLSHDGDMQVLRVIDDGKGLPVEQHAGMGLRSMRYRAEVIGAKLCLKGNEQGGATLECVFKGEPIPTF